MPEATGEKTTYTQEQLDAAIKEAKSGQDRFVQAVQEGKELPKWVRDAGFDSAEKALAALKRPAASEQEPTKRTAQTLDVAKYLDEDGQLVGEGLARYTADLLSWTEQHTNDVLTEREKAAAMQAETALVAEMAKTAPPLLVADDPEGAEIVEAAIDGLVARRSRDGNPMSKDEIAKLRDQVVAHYGRVADREVVRRAAEAEAAKEKLPPNERPSAGDGQPHAPEPEKPPRHPRDTLAEDRAKSRAAFAARHQA